MRIIISDKLLDECIQKQQQRRTTESLKRFRPIAYYWKCTVTEGILDSCKTHFATQPAKALLVQSYQRDSIVYIPVTDNAKLLIF